jgi:hypothetical protein
MRVCFSVPLPSTSSAFASSTTSMTSTSESMSSTSISVAETPSSTSVTIQTLSSLVISSNSTQVTNATAIVATVPVPTDPLPSDSVDSAALIGGIVGGVVGLLLIGGLIAFLVTRSRRRAKGEPSNNAALQSVRQSMSNNAGAGVASQRSSNYEPLPLSPNPSQHNYVAWSSEENGYAKPSPNRSEYEYGDFAKAH